MFVYNSNMRTEEKPCPKCRIRPRKPACGYCRECYNAYNRERYKAKREAEGLSVLTLEERDQLDLERNGRFEEQQERSRIEVVMWGKSLAAGRLEPDPDWTDEERAAYDMYVAYEMERIERITRDA